MSKRYEQAKAYTEKYRGKLSPCRICGNTDIRIASDRESFVLGNDCKAVSARLVTKTVWFAACSTPHCDCAKSSTSVKTAVDNWNKQQNLLRKEMIKCL